MNVYSVTLSSIKKRMGQMDQTLFDAAIATLTTELDNATDERMKERLRDGIASLKNQFPEFVAVAE
jgi:hypothetical protein